MGSILKLGLPIAAVGAIGVAVLVHPWPAAATLDERSQQGIAEYETGHPEKGQQTLEGVLAADPQHPGALVGLALAELREGKEADAERKLETALQKDPGNFNAHMARAMIFRRHKDPERARADFEAAHKSQPKEAGPAYNLAVLATERGDLASARALYTEYLKLDPGSSDRPQIEATIADLDRRLGSGGK